MQYSLSKHLAKSNKKFKYGFTYTRSGTIGLELYRLPDPSFNPAQVCLETDPEFS
jgi:hypothetical protein